MLAFLALVLSHGARRRSATYQRADARASGASGTKLQSDGPFFFISATGARHFARGGDVSAQRAALQLGCGLVGVLRCARVEGEAMAAWIISGWIALPTEGRGWVAYHEHCIAYGSSRPLRRLYVARPRQLLSGCDDETM